MNKREFNSIFNKLLIIDGSFLLHRSLHVPKIFELRAPNGIRSGGVYQCIKMINSELNKCAEYYPVVCFDSGLSLRRVNEDKNYKHALERNLNPHIITEEESDNDYLYQYRSQRSILMDILSYAGIPSLRFNNTEGDDLMYILSKMSKDSLVLTDDADMLQLITDNCKVRRPMHDVTYNKESFLEEYKFNNIYEFVINKAIIGDGSDNIPGCCKGVSSGTSHNIIKIMNMCHKLGIDFEKIIHDENSLRNFCKDNDVKFFKSYLNFDISRYKTNIELVDLDKVAGDENITDFIIESIISIISSCKDKMNYFLLVKKLNEYAIRDVPLDNLINTINVRSKNILLGEIYE